MLLYAYHFPTVKPKKISSQGASVDNLDTSGLATKPAMHQKMNWEIENIMTHHVKDIYSLKSNHKTIILEVVITDKVKI